MAKIHCLCDKRSDITCNETECSIAGLGEPGNRNSCRVCWIRLGRKPAKLPSLVRRALNYAVAIYNYVRKGRPVVSEDEANRRLSICETCSWFNPEGDGGFCGHPKCGCPLRRKVVLGSEHCPLTPPKW